MSGRLRPEIIAELNDAWLGVNPANHAFIKPLDLLKDSSIQNDPDEFHKRLIWLMSQTDYLSFFCKHILNVHLLPFQLLILQELWARKFPMFIMSRGGSKTFLLSLYATIRAVLIPGRKIVAVGAAFRQSKFIHEYMENFWKGSPILRDMCDSGSGPRRDVDMCRMIFGTSSVVALPIGDGSKIRGQRAQDILADEFASHSREIFETVIAGFASVTASPAENVRMIAAQKRALELGIPLDNLPQFEQQEKGNQIVLSGTCDYAFGHFAEYWGRWKSIINSAGDLEKLETVFNGLVPEGFNWRDYSVIRIPYDMIPRGFMDETQMARAKATVNTGVFSMEYEAVFPKDSKGFFKRSLIESCVGTDSNPIKLTSGDVYFNPAIRGNPNMEHVIAVDPASEIDNFSIIVLELREDHQRIVFCWTTTRKQHVERVKRGLTKERDFYGYCARKIRDLMVMFPTVHISMDSQGGGIAVNEALHDPDKFYRGEEAIWPIIDENKEKDTDHQPGLHILELCSFSNAEWLSGANHGLRKDMEDKVIIFPMFDPLTIGLSIEDDKIYGRGSTEPDSDGLYDTLEDCVMEVEELKNELCIIEHTRTNAGRDRWDTPEVKIGIGKKSKIRKDRYSALLMANMAARQRSRNMKYEMKCDSIGGFAMPSLTASEIRTGFTGPDWYVSKMNGVYD